VRPGVHSSPVGGTSRELRIGYVPLVRNGGPVWAAGVLVAAAALSGCTTTVTGTARPAADGGLAAGATRGSALPTRPPGPDAAHLQAALLQLSDLPGGWSSWNGETTDDETMPGLAECTGARDTSADRVVVKGTPDLVDGHGDNVHAMVVSYPSQDDVDTDTAILTSPSASDCFARAFDDAAAGTTMPEGASVGSLSFTMTPGSAGGPAGVVASGAGTLAVVAANGRRFPVYVDVVFIAGRLTEAELVFLSAGTRLPAALRGNAVAAVAQRVAAL
jgi:hypothetical protein